MRGYDARHIDAKTPANIRTETLAWFESVPNAILCNCGILTAGYDCPDIKTIIFVSSNNIASSFSCKWSGVEVDQHQLKINLLF